MIAKSSVPWDELKARVPSTIRAFWEAPVNAVPLAWFRIGLSAVLLMQTLSLIGHLSELHGRHGIVEWSVTSDRQAAGVPHMAWLETALRLVDGPTTFAVPLAVAMYVGGLLGLLVENHTRMAAAAAWLLHPALMSSGELSTYGVDSFAQIGLFYCVVCPVGQTLSMDTRRKPCLQQTHPTFSAWLGIRTLQLHVCIAYVASGVEKGLGPQWWNGDAVWRALMSAWDGCIDCSFLATIPCLAQLAGWLTLLLEAGVPLFVWHPRLRKIWLFGIVGMHLGIAATLNLWAFSAIMIVFDVTAFGIATPVMQNATGTLRPASRVPSMLNN